MGKAKAEEVEEREDRGGNSEEREGVGRRQWNSKGLMAIALRTKKMKEYTDRGGRTAVGKLWGEKEEG